MALQSGFGVIFDFFKKADWYKIGNRYEFLKEHVLSQDQNKLGVVQKILYRIMDFRCKIQCDETMLLSIFSENSMKDVNILQLRSIIETLQNIQGVNLEEYLQNLFDLYGRGNEPIDKCIEYVVAENIYSYNEMKDYVLEQLYYFSDAEEVSDEKKVENELSVIQFFQIDMLIFEKWYRFVTDSCMEDVVYHTYHSTKGLEFDNVVIFMNAKFGKRQTFFSDLLEVLAIKNNEGEIGTSIESARNLLYVAVTRAAKNLCIVYFDSLENQDEAKKNVTSVFGEIKEEMDK